MPLYEKKVRPLVGFRVLFSNHLQWFGFFVVLGVLRALFVARVHAQTEAADTTTWSVRLHAESACTEDPSFVRALQDPIPLAQRAPSDTAELVAEVHLARGSESQHATIRVFDRILQTEAGSRELDLPLLNCWETAEALALVVGVLVEAGRTLREAAPAPDEPAPAPLPPPEPPPPTESEEAPAPARPARKRYAWLGPRAGHDLTVQAGMGWGLLPGSYKGGTAGWGIRGRRAIPVWLSATGWLPQESESGHARFASVYGSISVCPLTGSRGRVRGQICPTASAGVLWAVARQLAVQRERQLLLLLAGLEFKGDLRLWGPLALSLTARAEAPLTRERFVYYRADGAAPEIHQAQPVTLTLLGGLSLLFR